MSQSERTTYQLINVTPHPFAVHRLFIEPDHDNMRDMYAHQYGEMPSDEWVAAMIDEMRERFNPITTIAPLAVHDGYLTARVIIHSEPIPMLVTEYGYFNDSVTSLGALQWEVLDGATRKFVRMATAEEIPAPTDDTVFIVSVACAAAMQAEGYNVRVGAKLLKDPITGEMYQTGFALPL